MSSHLSPFLIVVLVEEKKTPKNDQVVVRPVLKLCCCIREHNPSSSEDIGLQRVGVQFNTGTARRRHEVFTFPSMSWWPQLFFLFSLCSFLLVYLLFLYIIILCVVGCGYYYLFCCCWSRCCWQVITDRRCELYCCACASNKCVYIAYIIAQIPGIPCHLWATCW